MTKDVDRGVPSRSSYVHQ